MDKARIISLIRTSFACSALLLSACSQGSANSTSSNSLPVVSEPMAGSSGIWVTSWADAPKDAEGSGGTGQTFREIVKPSVGSRGTIRLHFSNYFGTAPITIGAVHIAKQSSGAAVIHDTSVTFDKQASITIPAGGFATSDTVSFSFAYGDLLAVSEYLPGTWTTLTEHNQGPNIVTSYATGNNIGNATADINGASFTQTMYSTYLLDRVDVFGNYKGTIVAFGSSTTDGYRSTLDKHMSYPEQLAGDLHAAGRDDLAIANEGIAGNQMLIGGSSGDAGTSRFARDVLAIPGVLGVINDLGANDLRVSCVKASNLITGIQNTYTQAHVAGVRFYQATMPPSTFCGAQNPSGFGTRYAQFSGEESERYALLAWEKSLSTSVDGISEVFPTFDQLYYFNAALTDSSNQSYMLPKYDSGDDVHPNDAGYGAMAKAVTLSTLP